MLLRPISASTGPTRCSISNTRPTQWPRLNRSWDGPATSFLETTCSATTWAETLLRWSGASSISAFKRKAIGRDGETVYRIRCWNLSLHEWLLTALGDLSFGKGRVVGSPFLKSVFVAPTKCPTGRDRPII